MPVLPLPLPSPPLFPPPRHRVFPHHLGRVLALTSSLPAAVASSSLAQDYSNEEMNIELLTLMPWSMLIVIALANIMLTNPTSKLAGNRMLVNAVIQTAVCSPVIGIGLAAWCGIDNGPLNLVCFFLCIGTAMADTFIMTAEAQRVMGEDPNLPLPEYGATVLSRAGPFGLMTTLTTVIAFGIGMNTVYPSMVLFAKYAMLVMSFAHIYVITYFVANLVLKQDRIRKRKHDGCPCFIITSEEPPGKKPPDASLANTRLEKLIDNYVAPAITSRNGKAIVMLTFLSLVGFSVYGVTQIKAGMETSDVTPSRSHYTTFLNTRERLNPNDGGVVNVYLSEEVTWYDEQQMHNVNSQLWNRLASTTLYTGGINSPWITFNETCYFFGPLLISGMKTTPAKDSTFEPSSGAADLTSCYQSEEAFQMALYHFMYTSPFTAVGLSARDAIVHAQSEWAKAVTKVVASSMSYSKGQEGSSLSGRRSRRARRCHLLHEQHAQAGVGLRHARRPRAARRSRDHEHLHGGLLRLLLDDALHQARWRHHRRHRHPLRPAADGLPPSHRHHPKRRLVLHRDGRRLRHRLFKRHRLRFRAQEHAARRASEYAMVTMAQPIFVGGLASFFCVAPLAAASVPTASVFATMVGGIVAIGIYMGFIVLPVLLTLFTPLSAEARGAKSAQYTAKGKRTSDTETAAADTTRLSVDGVASGSSAAAPVTPSDTSDEITTSVPASHVSVVPGSAPHPSPPPSAPSGTDDAGDDFGTAPPRRKTAWGMWAA